MVFGHSRGNYEVPRNALWEGSILRLYETLYGEKFQTNAAQVFENDTFVLRDYWWGNCSCGFEDHEFEEEHRDECYQAELRRERIAAGAKYDKDRMDNWPKNFSYDKIRSIEDGIYKKLTKKYSLPMVGCAVHCTCDMQKRYEKWLDKIGYPYGCREDCKLVLPNFHHKKSGYKLAFYKYPLRDSYANIELSHPEFDKLIIDCINSLRTEDNLAD